MAGFLPSAQPSLESTVVRNNALACNNPCVPGEDYSTAFGNSSWDNAHTSNPFSRGERLGRDLSTFVQCSQRTGGS